MLARHLPAPTSAARHVRVIRLYSVASASLGSERPASSSLSHRPRRRPSSTEAASGRHTGGQARNSWPDRYAEVTKEEAQERHERTLHFTVQGGLTSMEDALTVWRALEGKYGPLRDIVFPRVCSSNDMLYALTDNVILGFGEQVEVRAVLHRTFRQAIPAGL